MDEAPGVADRGLILSGMLVCSTASGQTLHSASMGIYKRLVDSLANFRRRSVRRFPA